MSIQAAAASDATTAGLPAVNQAFEPKWVRDGSEATQKAYETALSFEQTLVEQLAKSMTATSGLEGESSQGESGSEEGGSLGAGANSGELSSMLPQALASGVMSAGGLGLAAQMTRELEGTQSAAQTRATGGTAPVTSAAPAASAAPVAGEGAGATGGTSS
jgi:Rod binding domain-containing protein